VAFDGTTGLGNFFIPANQQSCTVQFQTVADDFVEQNENARLTVNAPIGNAASTSNTAITNDDLPFMITGIPAPNNNVNGFVDGGGTRYAEEGNTEAATSTVTFQVVRALCSTGTLANPGGAGTGLCDGGDTAALAAGQTVAFTMTGAANNGGGNSDYALSVATPLTFGAASTSQTTVMTPVADIVVENDEDAIFTAAANAASYRQGNAAATAFINDDDEDVRVGTPVPAFISEAGPGSMTYPVTRNKLSAGLVAGGNNPVDPTALGLTANFSFLPVGVVPNNPATTCTDASDFTVTNGGGVTYVPAAGCNGQISFAATVTAGSIIVTPTNDATPENNENVTVNIPANPGGPANA